jgi:proteic killer suppression protein
VKIRNFVHKGLKRLYYDDEVKGLPAESVDKLRKMLAFLQEMGTADELQTIPVWKAHQLTGKRRGDMELVCHTKLAPDLYGRPWGERDLRR